MCRAGFNDNVRQAILLSLSPKHSLKSKSGAEVHGEIGSMHTLMNMAAANCFRDNHYSRRCHPRSCAMRPWTRKRPRDLKVWQSKGFLALSESVACLPHGVFYWSNQGVWCCRSSRHRRYYHYVTSKSHFVYSGCMPGSLKSAFILSTVTIPGSANSVLDKR